MSLTKLPTKAETLMRQEIEMVIYRLALQYFPQLAYIEGNPMTVEQATKHLDGVVKYIQVNIELYQK